MYERNEPTAAEFEASLKRLGIRELEERLEVAPLLVDGGGDGPQEVDPNFPELCCVCKIGQPLPDPDESLPYPTMDPSGGVSTGPTNPTGGRGI